MFSQHLDAAGHKVSVRLGRTDGSLLDKGLGNACKLTRLRQGLRVRQARFKQAFLHVFYRYVRQIHSLTSTPLNRRFTDAISP